MLIYRLIDMLFSIFTFLLLARMIISFIRPGRHDPRWRKVIRIIYQLTEPVLAPIREKLPVSGSGLDFSPLVVLLGMMILKQILFYLLVV
ncbi:MAG: YggT family protein [Halanaerobiaceae bacterium]